MMVRPGDIVLSTCSNLPAEMRGVMPLTVIGPDGADNYTALPVYGVKPYSIGAKSIIYVFPDTTAQQQERLPYSFPMTWRTTPLSDDKVVVNDPTSATPVTGNFRGVHDGKAVVVVGGYQRYFPMDMVSLAPDQLYPAATNKGELSYIKYAYDNGLFAADMQAGKLTPAHAYLVLSSAGYTDLFEEYFEDMEPLIWDIAQSADRLAGMNWSPPRKTNPYAQMIARIQKPGYFFSDFQEETHISVCPDTYQAPPSHLGIKDYCLMSGTDVILENLRIKFWREGWFKGVDRMLIKADGGILPRETVLLLKQKCYEYLSEKAGKEKAKDQDTEMVRNAVELAKTTTRDSFVSWYETMSRKYPAFDAAISHSAFTTQKFQPTADGMYDVFGRDKGEGSPAAVPLVSTGTDAGPVETGDTGSSQTTDDRPVVSSAEPAQSTEEQPDVPHSQKYGINPDVVRGMIARYQSDSGDQLSKKEFLDDSSIERCPADLRYDRDHAERSATELCLFFKGKPAFRLIPDENEDTRFLFWAVAQDVEAGNQIASYNLPKIKDYAWKQFEKIVFKYAYEGKFKFIDAVAQTPDSPKEPWQMTRAEFIPEREINIAPSSGQMNVVGPTLNRFKEGDYTIDIGEDPYIYKFAYVNPNEVDYMEKWASVEDVLKMPSTQAYIQWYKEGKEPWPITVIWQQIEKKYKSTNRRRIVSARAAGIDRIPAFVEVGKYKDIIRQALAEGKPVPAEVLAQYPEMAVSSQTTEEQPTVTAPKEPWQMTFAEFVDAVNVEITREKNGGIFAYATMQGQTEPLKRPDSGNVYELYADAEKFNPNRPAASEGGAALAAYLKVFMRDWLMTIYDEAVSNARAKGQAIPQSVQDALPAFHAQREAAQLEKDIQEYREEGILIPAGSVAQVAANLDQIARTLLPGTKVDRFLTRVDRYLRDAEKANDTAAAEFFRANKEVIENADQKPFLYAKYLETYLRKLYRKYASLRAQQKADDARQRKQDEADRWLQDIQIEGITRQAEMLARANVKNDPSLDFDDEFNRIVKEDIQKIEREGRVWKSGTQVPAFTLPTPDSPLQTPDSPKEPWQMTRAEFIPDREINVAPSSGQMNVVGPTLNRFKEGDYTIDIGEDPYIYKFAYVNPNEIDYMEKWASVEDVLKMPSTQAYIQWYKEGKEPWPITVIWQQIEKKFKSTNRRRIVAARAAGIDRIPAFVEVGKYKDIIRQALAEGKPVPAEVLAQYPEIAASSQPTPSPLLLRSGTTSQEGSQQPTGISAYEMRFQQIQEKAKGSDSVTADVATLLEDINNAPDVQTPAMLDLRRRVLIYEGKLRGDQVEQLKLMLLKANSPYCYQPGDESRYYDIQDRLKAGLPIFAAIEKAPWQMTFAEFVAEREAGNGKEYTSHYLAGNYYPENGGRYAGGVLRKEHYDAVKKAVKAGLPVPEKVKSEYPVLPPATIVLPYSLTPGEFASAKFAIVGPVELIGKGSSYAVLGIAKNSQYTFVDIAEDITADAYTVHQLLVEQAVKEGKALPQAVINAYKSWAFMKGYKKIATPQPAPDMPTTTYTREAVEIALQGKERSLAYESHPVRVAIAEDVPQEALLAYPDLANEYRHQIENRDLEAAYKAGIMKDENGQEYPDWRKPIWQVSFDTFFKNCEVMLWGKDLYVTWGGGSQVYSPFNGERFSYEISPKQVVGLVGPEIQAWAKTYEPFVDKVKQLYFQWVLYAHEQGYYVPPVAITDHNRVKKEYLQKRDEPIRGMLPMPTAAQAAETQTTPTMPAPTETIDDIAERDIAEAKKLWDAAQAQFAAGNNIAATKILTNWLYKLAITTPTYQARVTADGPLLFAMMLKDGRFVVAFTGIMNEADLHQTIPSEIVADTETKASLVNAVVRQQLQARYVDTGKKPYEMTYREYLANRWAFDTYPEKDESWERFSVAPAHQQAVKEALIGQLQNRDPANPNHVLLKIAGNVPDEVLAEYPALRAEFAEEIANRDRLKAKQAAQPTPDMPTPTDQQAAMQYITNLFETGKGDMPGAEPPAEDDRTYIPRKGIEGLPEDWAWPSSIRFVILARNNGKAMVREALDPNGKTYWVDFDKLDPAERKDNPQAVARYQVQGLSPDGYKLIANYPGSRHADAEWKRNADFIGILDRARRIDQKARREIYALSKDITNHNRPSVWDAIQSELYRIHPEKSKTYEATLLQKVKTAAMKSPNVAIRIVEDMIEDEWYIPDSVTAFVESLEKITPDMPAASKTPDSQLPTPNSRLQTPDSQLPTLSNNPHQDNLTIARWVKAKADQFGDNVILSPDEAAFVARYVGGGGMQKYGAKEGDYGSGVLSEFYTPDSIAAKMVALAHQHGYTNGPVLEPSCGTGRFLQYFPANEAVTGIEMQRTSYLIAKWLYPTFTVRHMQFEELFTNARTTFMPKERYDLVIGNPPYGTFSGKYASIEKKQTDAQKVEEYFMLRGLQLLNPGGLMVFIIGCEPGNGATPWLRSGPSKIKTRIGELATLIDAYRLPAGVFDFTDVVSDILVFRRK